MTETDKTLQPEQSQAIAEILTGKTDQDIADAVGVTRQTVNIWRNHNALFIAELNQQRATIWASQIDRLRGLVCGAIDTLGEAVHDEDPKEARAAAVHILKACGLYGRDLQPLGLTDRDAVESEQRRDAILNSW